MKTKVKMNLQLKLGISFLIILITIAIAGPFLPFVDNELTKEGMRRIDGKMEIPPFPPSEENWLGTDRYGVDVFSMLVLGTKEVLLIIFSITILRYIIAVPMGVMAFYSKWIKGFMDFISQAFSFVPAIFMIILLVNLPYLMYSPNRLWWAIVIIALLEVGRVSELIFTQVRSISSRTFIEAAITVGTSPPKLFRKYYLPALLPELTVNFFLDLGRTLFIVGQLGVINIYITHKIQVIQAAFIPVFEVQNTSNAWPLLFDQVLFDIYTYQWIPFSACIAISIVVYGFFTLSEGLRKHFKYGYQYF
ncbi:ABC transporter permease [Bacillus carboniphilus]|uniref:ABC transporter permease n=1 Tax=Bacillus carboniphilus TaxID=86663 RepID=A0ABP3GCE6_9BACI